ncbi:MAG: hypothetical protein SZ59_C0001G0112 [candidate division TM6 bacterium GW2011_GWF2_28_16]|nr:MAG: hypothetical protein SZ59_C0001G0112 [candidate division TM6 bacterium GW2011_GWF2_28_16]
MILVANKIIIIFFISIILNLSGHIENISFNNFPDRKEIYYSKNKQIYSVKINNKNYALIKYTEEQEYLRESTKLKKLKHPNIIKIKANNDQEQLLLEKQGSCSLYNFIKSPDSYIKNLDNTKLNSIKDNIIKDVINAINYLHTEKNYVHLDLKAENIILFIKQDRENTIIIPKIIDFESCYKIKNINLGLKKFMGTFEYAPPEIIELIYKSMQYTVSFYTDIYDLGLLILFIIYKITPSEIIFSRENMEFNDLNTEWSKNKFLIENIKYINWLENFLAKINDTSNTSKNNLILSCCAKNPKDRPTIQNIKV